MVRFAITTKEFLEKRYTFAQDWITNVTKKVQTDSAKKLLNAFLIHSLILGGED